MNTSHWIVWNRITNQRKDCLSPCNFLMINVGSKNQEVYPNSTYSLQAFYFAPRYKNKPKVFFQGCHVAFDFRVMQSIEHFLYPFLSLAAEIGGYVGLLLGVSFFHLATFIRDSIDERLRRYNAAIASVIKPINIKPMT